MGVVKWLVAGGILAGLVALLCKKEKPEMGIFGDTTAYSSNMIARLRVAGIRASCPKFASAQSITALLMNTVGPVAPLAKCAIYQCGYNKLIGVTEEKTINLSTTPAWFTFNFSDPKPVLMADDYFIVCTISNDASSGVGYSVEGSSYKRVQSNPTGGYAIAFTDPLYFNEYMGSASIYCTYFYNKRETGDLKGTSWSGTADGATGDFGSRVRALHRTISLNQ